MTEQRSENRFRPYVSGPDPESDPDPDPDPEPGPEPGPLAEEEVMTFILISPHPET
jgi:hypothetical protein